MEVRLGPTKAPDPDPAELDRIVKAIILKRTSMHYRNGREAKNGDRVVQLEGGKVVASGTLIEAVPGNDHCNGSIVTKHPHNATAMIFGACLCDCLHIEDVAAMLTEKGLDKRPTGK